MRTPSNCFDSSLMLTPLESRLCVELFPHHELVVVASGSELTVFLVPF